MNDEFNMAVVVYKWDNLSEKQKNLIRYNSYPITDKKDKKKIRKVIDNRLKDMGIKNAKLYTLGEL